MRADYMIDGGMMLNERCCRRGMLCSPASLKFNSQLRNGRFQTILVLYCWVLSDLSLSLSLSSQAAVGQHTPPQVDASLLGFATVH